MPDKVKAEKPKKLKKGEQPPEEPAAEAAAPPAMPGPSLIEAMSGAQKAAAVIVSLGVDKASQLYQYMDPEDVEMITLEVAKLGYIDSDSTEAILNEYYQMCMTNKAVTEGGLEYARTVLEKAFGAQTANELLGKVTKSLKNREFSFMNKAGAVVHRAGQGGGGDSPAGAGRADKGGRAHSPDGQRVAHSS